MAPTSRTLFFMLFCFCISACFISTAGDSASHGRTRVEYFLCVAVLAFLAFVAHLIPSVYRSIRSLTGWLIKPRGPLKYVCAVIASVALQFIIEEAQVDELFYSFVASVLILTLVLNKLWTKDDELGVCYGFSVAFVFSAAGQLRSPTTPFYLLTSLICVIIGVYAASSPPCRHEVFPDEPDVAAPAPKVSAP